MIGTDHAVSCIDGCALNDGQDVALNALARHIRAAPGLAPGDLVYLVEEDNSIVFDAFDGGPGNLVHIDELLLFLLDQVLHCLVDPHFSLLGAPGPEHVGEHFAEINVHLLYSLRSIDLKVPGEAPLLDFDFDDSAP